MCCGRDLCVQHVLQRSRHGSLCSTAHVWVHAAHRHQSSWAASSPVGQLCVQGALQPPQIEVLVMVTWSTERPGAFCSHNEGYGAGTMQTLDWLSSHQEYFNLSLLLVRARVQACRASSTQGRATGDESA